MTLTQISTDGVKDDAVTAGKIPANAVGSSELADNAVDTAAIAADAVTGAKIADDAIGSGHYADGSIDTAHIADDAVTNAKIAAGAVGGTQLGGNSVTAAKIGANEVTAAAIAAGAVGNAKIADQAVTLDKLAHGTSSNDGKFLRANNGADPSFETVSIPSGTTINNQADNRLITCTGTTDTLNGEAGLTFYMSSNDPILTIEGTNSAGHPQVTLKTGGTTDHCSLNMGDSGDHNAGMIQYTNSNNDMQFHTNGSEKMRILSGGGITFNGDTAAANALDDYEEGTYNPTLTGYGSTTSFTLYSSEDTLSYLKIGKNCWFTGRIRINDDQYSGYVRMTLPFASAQGTDCSNCGMSAVSSHGVTFADSIDKGLFFETYTNTTLGVFIFQREDTGWTNATNAHITGNNYLTFNHFYITQ